MGGTNHHVIESSLLVRFLFFILINSKWTISNCCKKLFAFYTDMLKKYFINNLWTYVLMCVMSLWFLAVVETYSDVGQSPLSFRGVVCTFISPTSPVVMGTWGSVGKRGRQSLALDGSQWKAVTSLYCKCVWHQKAPFPLEFFLWVVQLHTFCVVFTKKNLLEKSISENTPICPDSWRA